MGKQKYQKEVEELFLKSPVVSYSTVERFIKNKKKVKQYVKRFIYNLIKNGKINRITKGYYSKQDDPSLAVFCFQPAYLGLQDALSFHNLWDQESIPIVITTRAVRQGIRKVFGLNVQIKRIDKKYLFGVEYNQEGNIAYPYSDIEKTLIDMVYYNRYLDKEVLRDFKKRINNKKLLQYLKKYPKRISGKVLKSMALREN